VKVLVTGGAGFIGSHIVDTLLREGHTAVVLDNLSTGRRENLPGHVPIHEIDICDRDGVRNVLEQERPDAVCHQAAQMSVGRSVKEPSFDAEVNILGFLNVLEAAAETGVKRIVFASSGGVLYGDVTEPQPETYPANPISPYGISKWAGERYLRFFTAEHGLETVALRYSNVYGPRQNPHGEAGVVAIFCQRMLAGEETRINGDGKYIRDYVYVADVARANFLALTQSLPEQHIALNVGTGIGLDVNDLSSKLHALSVKQLEAAGKSIDIPASTYGPARPGDLRSNLVDASLLQRTWDWQAKTSLDAGLSETVEWFFAHGPQN